MSLRRLFFSSFLLSQRSRFRSLSLAFARFRSLGKSIYRSIPDEGEGAPDHSIGQSSSLCRGASRWLFYHAASPAGASTRGMQKTKTYTVQPTG
eukprot:scaffold3215_cov105-Pinguiococcus_pyrenoidosus.AAC.1